MTKTKRSPSKRRPAPRAETWRNSDELYLLKCYDVWSATPPRGCECDSTLSAAA